MLRRALESSYERTVGAVRDLLARYTQPVRSRLGWVEVLYIFLTIAFTAGFVNAFFFPLANQSYIIYPAGGAQTITETVINSFVILIGGAGIYVVYQSGRQTTKARLVSLYLALAIVLIFLSVAMGILLSTAKGG